MPRRPDHIKCIVSTHASCPGESLCGRLIGVFEWVFTSIDHAFYAVKAGDRLLPCDACARAVISTLEVK